MHLSPLGFAACQSKKCTNQANSDPPTDFTDLHRTACWGCSPTEYADFTELLAEDVLPQIAQIYTEAANFRGCTCLKCTNRANSGPPTDFTDFTETLTEWFSHRFHRSTQMVRVRKIVAEVSLPPQQQNASHRFHRFTQKLLISGWCTSWLVHFLVGTLLGWYTSWLVHFLVGALETSAPPENSIRSIRLFTQPSNPFNPINPLLILHKQQ